MHDVAVVDGEDFLRVGQSVRVTDNCPHTLPAYARTMRGVVVGHTEDDMVMVRFGTDQEFPIPPECLERFVPPPSEPPPAD